MVWGPEQENQVGRDQSVEECQSAFLHLKKGGAEKSPADDGARFIIRLCEHKVVFFGENSAGEERKKTTKDAKNIYRQSDLSIVSLTLFIPRVHWIAWSYPQTAYIGIWVYPCACCQVA